jgi:type II secretory pathway component PulM
MRIRRASTERRGTAVQTVILERLEQQGIAVVRVDASREGRLVAQGHELAGWSAERVS